MAKQQVTVHLKLAWWAQPYLRTLDFLCRSLGLEPNADRVSRVLSHAIRVEVE